MIERTNGPSDPASLRRGVPFAELCRKHGLETASFYTSSPLPVAAKLLRRAMFFQSIAPLQDTTIDKDNVAGNVADIGGLHAMALREERRHSGRRCVLQPEKMAHHHPLSLRRNGSRGNDSSK